AKEYQKSTPNTKRVNKDDLRLMVDDGVWSEENEKLILQIQDQIILAAINKGYDVLVDNTNFGGNEKRIRNIVGSKATIEIKDFTNVSLDECIKRDQNRATKVGEDVIKQTYDRYLAPKSVEPPIIEYNPSLTNCYLFDCDGTLAIKGNNRGIYEFEKSLDDVPNISVIKTLQSIVKSNLDITIIFMTGREDKFRDITTALLKKIGAISTQSNPILLMRTSEDTRNDSIVKKELYEHFIKNKFNVIAVFDDRDRVVKMWRSIGLSCFQVAPGDF
ncbi:MAG: polynucleotide kinase, partial [Nanoarchaeota archaeon]